MSLATMDTRIANSHRSVAAGPRVTPDLPRYRLANIIGQGGMGVVYQATDHASGRHCAVKMIGPEQRTDHDSMERMCNERDVLKRLSHPAIVSFIDGGEAEDGSPYVVMERLSGPNLDDAVRENGPLSAQRVIEILHAICLALEAIHAEKIVHRDIKPANIVSTDDDGHLGGVKLIDFGLAYCLPEQGDASKPATSSFAGSPLFAAPELASGEASFRSDIYSLGATAYFLLTGRPVFDEQHPLEAIMAHATRTPVSLECAGSDVPSSLNAIIMKCLDKRPEQRYQTVSELAAALKEVDCLQGSGTPADSDPLLLRTPLPAYAAPDGPRALSHETVHSLLA